MKCQQIKRSGVGGIAVDTSLITLSDGTAYYETATATVPNGSWNIVQRTDSEERAREAHDQLVDDLRAGTR